MPSVNCPDVLPGSSTSGSGGIPRRWVVLVHVLGSEWGSEDKLGAHSGGCGKETATRGRRERRKGFSQDGRKEVGCMCYSL